MARERENVIPVNVSGGCCQDFVLKEIFKGIIHPKMLSFIYLPLIYNPRPYIYVVESLYRFSFFWGTIPFSTVWGYAVNY